MKKRHLFRFETEAEIRRAVEQLPRLHEFEFETYSPYPLEIDMPAIPDKIASLAGHEAGPGELRPRPLAVAAFLGGAAGAVLGYWMQWFTEASQFPRMVADRPANSWPAFVPVTFEMTVLGAALSIYFCFFLRTRLPRLNHPVFEAPKFDRASQDQFFLELKFDETEFRERLPRLIESLRPIEVSHVEI